MKEKAQSAERHRPAFESLSPYLQRILPQVQHGSEPALRKLRGYVEQDHKKQNFEAHAITQVLFDRLKVTTTAHNLKELLETLVFSSTKDDEELEVMFLEESFGLLGAIERYLQVASLLEHTKDTEDAWNSLLAPNLCIYRAMSRIIHMGYRKRDPDSPPTRIPSVNIFKHASALTVQLWLFHSRTLHLVTRIHLDAFSMLCKAIYSLLNFITSNPDMGLDIYAAVVPYLCADDVVILCVAHLERHYQSRDKGLAPHITVGALTIIRVIHDHISNQRERVYEDRNLVPALATILRRTLLSFPLRHTMIDRVHNTVADHVCALLGDVMLYNPLRAIRIPQALNCGLWTACRRLTLLGTCECSPHANKGIYDGASDTICPWCRGLDSKLDPEHRTLASFPILLSRYLVDTLLEGRSSAYRQLEKAMRRSASEEAKQPVYLKRHTPVPEWERNVQVMCRLLEKRRQYGEFLRAELCDLNDCHALVYPKDLQVCGGCLSCHYCSRLCQKFAWKRYHHFECVLPENCKYPLKKTAVDYDFLDWLYEDSPDLEEAGYGLFTDSDSGECDSEED